MALDDLLAAIEGEAEARAGAALAEGRREAARILADAGARRGRRRAEALASVEELAAAAAVAGLAASRRAAREVVLLARERALERVFAAARSRLAQALATDRYRASLPERLAEALAFAGDGPRVVRCAPALGPALRPLARARGLPLEEDPEVGPGFRVVAAGGEAFVDDLLDERLRRLRPELSIELVRRMEGEP